VIKLLVTYFQRNHSREVWKCYNFCFVKCIVEDWVENETQ